MNKEIIIKTTQVGVDLNDSYFEGATVYTNKIEQLNKWHNSISALELSEPGGEYLSKCKSLKSLIDLDALLCIAITDLGLITKELFLSKEILQSVFYIKHAYLVIYETFYNLNSSSNKRKILKDLVTNLASPDIILEFEEITYALREFNKNFGLETKIADIRNTLAGHIHKDFNKWYATVITLNGEETGKMISEFIKVISPLQQLSRNLLQIEMQALDKINQRIANEFDQTLSKLERVFDDLNKKIPDKDKHFDINLLKNIFNK